MTISTGQTKEQVKEIMTALTIEFMRLGFTQDVAVKMTKETVLKNYNLFK
jgi:intein-encoded DNA endonuclease-like protein